MSLISSLSQKRKNSAVLDLLNHCAVGLWIVQLHNEDPMHPKNKWKWSSEFRRMLGFQGDDTNGFPDVADSWKKRIHPDDIEQTFTTFTSCIKDSRRNSRYDIQQRIKCKNNEYHWFRIIGGVTHDTQEAAKQACGVLINIDDQVTSWSDRLHPDDVKHTFEDFAACLRNESSQTRAQYRLKTKSNAYRWFQAVGGVTCDTKGVPMRVCGSLIDIHEQKIAEQAYKEKLTDLTHNLEANISVVADRASSSSSNVASTAEELSASISEMNPKIARANEEIATAFEEATQANAIIHSLEEAANQIGNVVDLIKDISSQTNLLALNATIEAARAGDVGKGFAVVATEVKELASQTAAATEDITSQVDSLQSKSKKALQAMDVIRETMETIKGSSNELTQLIDEQRIATVKIADQLGETVKEINNVSTVINTTIDNAR